MKIVDKQMIEVNGLQKAYDSHKVLHNVSFSVKKGEIVGLLGPNGSGKTTIIRLLNGVINPDAGSVTVSDMDPQVHGQKIRQMSGIVTDGAGLYHEMSGRDNLLFFAKLYGGVGTDRIEELLELFQLTEHQHKAVGLYSTGMKKRLAMAKALLHRPELLFLDEPTNGLDPEGIQLVLDIVKRLNEKEGTTIFICSHILHQMESICTQYLFLEKGKILEKGTKQELEQKYLKNVVLHIETGLSIGTVTFNGYPVRHIENNTFEMQLPSKDEISNLLSNLLKETWIHHAAIVNRDLESLYFEVRRQANEL